jgi:hypothetical protein
MIPLVLSRHAPAPNFELAGENGETIALKTYRFRLDVLLFALHGPGCLHCVKIVGEMAQHRNDWEAWGTSLLLARLEEKPFDAPFRQAHDSKGVLRRPYTGDSDADVMIAVLDHRSRFMEGWSLDHPNPVDWREIAETVRWVAIQEPECGACEVLPGWGDS